VGASTTRLVAGAECTPAGDHAVDRASVLVAVARLPKVGALVSTVLSMLNDSTGTAVISLAARLGARAPFSPSTDVTVDGTRATVADLGFAEESTALATVSGSVDDSASARHGTITTGLRARTPVFPQ
jgi:hypothetical protein